MELTFLFYFVYAIYALLGIGIIIFIHEMGHFLAAKRAGVRVEKFCLGFDPTIRGRKLRFLSFRRGDTEYAIGAIPFGGYVKMAGETAMEKKGSDAPLKSDELLAKPPGTRAMVFAAGAAFNIASAFLFFIIAFRIGVNFTAPVIGQVEPGRPAWEAGLRPGDRVLRIDGAEVNDFHEIAIASALGEPERPRLFQVERDKKTLEPLAIVPEWASELGFHSIGIAPALGPEIKTVKKGSPAEQAGIRKGDRIVGLKVEGVFVPGPAALSHLLGEYLPMRPGAEFLLGITRPGEEEPRWLPMRLERKPASKPEPRLGVMPAHSVVESIRPGSPAALHLAPGDRVRTAGGKQVASLDWTTILTELGPRGPVELEVESVRGQSRTIILDAAELIRLSLEREVKWEHHLLLVAEVEEGSPFAGALKEGDLVVAAGPSAKPVFNPDELRKILSSEGSPLRLWRRRGSEVAQVDIPIEVSSALNLGLKWNTCPPVRVLPGSPAARAGMEPGSRILEIDGRPVRSWEALQAAVRGASSNSTTVRWIRPQGEEKQAVLDLFSGPAAQASPELDLGITLSFLQVRVQAGILQSFALGAKRTVVVAKDVFLTLKGLILREVAARNLAGPVGIIHLISRVSMEGIGTLIYYLALISVNLGLFNLLPFPILDGGHLLFLAIEKVKGSPVDVRIQEIVSTVAFFLIIGLALFVTYNDLLRLFRR